MRNEILDILSTGLFKKIFAGEILQIAEINTATTLLFKANIPFDLSFTPGDRRIAKEASLTVYVNPSTTIGVIIQFEAGTTVL